MAALDFPSSPSTGQTFTGPNGAVWSWDGTKWISATSGNLYSAINNVGRNYLHNSLMSIAQRTLPVTATGYTLDRWRAEAVTDTISFSQVALADADRAAIGDEDAVNALQNIFGGTGGAGAYNMVHQRIETPRRLAGDTVTVSFWAKATSGTPKIGISIDQVWNSVATNGTGTAVTLSTVWARYSAAFVVPSGSTKTQVATDYTQLNLWFSSGATNNTRAGSIGVQTGPFTVQLWGVQLELGSTATPLEKPDPQQDLAKCQRFYQVGYTQLGGYTTAAITQSAIFQFPVQMRATPLIAIPGGPLTATNVTGAAVNAITAYAYQIIGTGAATGGFNIQGGFTASADL